jgi:hypothetical protein
MREFHKIWIDQCAAAADIREGFGLASWRKSSGSSMGLNFAHISTEYSAWAHSPR